MGSPCSPARDHLGRRSGFSTHYNKHSGASLTCENEWISRNPVPRLLVLELELKQLTPLSGL